MSYPASLKAVGGARTGIAPVNLLDVLDVNGNYYAWADRAILAPSAMVGASVAAVPAIDVPAGQGVAWSFPTQAVAGTDHPERGSAFASPTMAELQYWGPGGATMSAARSDFTLPVLPAEAVIENAAFVFSSSITGVGATAVMAGEICGIRFGYGGLGAPSEGFNTGISTHDVGSGGFSAAGIAESNVVVELADDAAIAYRGGDMVCSLSFVGLAIFYTVPGVVIAGVAGSPGSSYGIVKYKPWLLSVPQFSFHRSLQTDIGAFVLQNLSGDTLSRDFEKIVRRSTLEGAFFIYRCWQPDAEASWLEVHGTLSVDPMGTDTAKLKGAQLLNPSQDDTPLENYCETCQIPWRGPRCGSTQTTECSYSFQTCQSLPRIMVALNDYEKNYGETTAATALNVINRRRKI